MRLGFVDTALDSYALGYYISSIPTGWCWNVRMYSSYYSGFLCGLNTELPNVNVLKELDLNDTVDISELMVSYWSGLTLLQLNYNSLSISSLIYLSELISCIPNLISV